MILEVGDVVVVQQQTTTLPSSSASLPWGHNVGREGPTVPSQPFDRVKHTCLVSLMCRRRRRSLDPTEDTRVLQYHAMVIILRSEIFPRVEFRRRMNLRDTPRSRKIRLMCFPALIHIVVLHLHPNKIIHAVGLPKELLLSFGRSPRLLLTSLLY